MNNRVAQLVEISWIQLLKSSFIFEKKCNTIKEFSRRSNHKLAVYVSYKLEGHFDICDIFRMVELHVCISHTQKREENSLYKHMPKSAQADFGWKLSKIWSSIRESGFKHYWRIIPVTQSQQKLYFTELYKAEAVQKKLETQVSVYLVNLHLL